MWLGPALFVTVSVLLWKYLGTVFIPELLARSIYRALPSLASMDLFVMANAEIIYFGGYFVIAIFWRPLKSYLKNPFIAGLALWLVNLFIILPLLGRGILGYRLPQGWVSVSLPLLLSHWMFARGLQFQDRRL
jgi:hypothetical protein